MKPFEEVETIAGLIAYWQSQPRLKANYVRLLHSTGRVEDVRREYVEGALDANGWNDPILTFTSREWGAYLWDKRQQYIWERARNTMNLGLVQ